MWPFSREKKGATGVPTTVASALEQLAGVGIGMRSGITTDDVLYSLGGTMASPVSWLHLLCTLGHEVERGNFERMSDDIWHFDTECIEDHGAYVAVVSRFVILAKGALPMTQIRDYVDVRQEKAWVEFTLDGKTEHWELKVDDDWVDPGLHSRIQQLVIPRGAGRRFFVVGLGQDCLISFGDDQMRQALSKLTGIEFQWN